MALEVRTENNVSATEEVEGEIQVYRCLTASLTSKTPVTGQWNMRDNRELDLQVTHGTEGYTPGGVEEGNC
ncbi:zinc finger BED domain-containing protein 1-like [Clarias magur]|uniref:Zinc finger BED domain-containing protein 1-like n=1 Tax=Clarias magur TaxID=1594786 RepID=A0A8J5CG70_CLAMG|nr:zinc finger BED domain-containing protein 1-like [Clarias magur]